MEYITLLEVWYFSFSVWAWISSESCSWCSFWAVQLSNWQLAGAADSAPSGWSSTRPLSCFCVVSDPFPVQLALKLTLSAGPDPGFLLTGKRRFRLLALTGCHCWFWGWRQFALPWKPHVLWNRTYLPQLWEVPGLWGHDLGSGPPGLLLNSRGWPQLLSFFQLWEGNIFPTSHTGLFSGSKLGFCSLLVCQL